MQVRVTAPLEVDGRSTEAVWLLVVLWSASAGDSFVGVQWRGTALMECVGRGRLFGGVHRRDGFVGVH